MTIPGIGPKHEHRQVVSVVEEIRKKVGRTVLAIVATDTFTLTAGSAVSTDVTVEGVLSTDQVLLQAADSGGASIDGVMGCYVTAGSGQFTVIHGASSATRTLRYFILA